MRYYQCDKYPIEFVVSENIDKYFDLHNHVGHYVISVVTQGTVTVCLENGEVEYRRGDVFTIPPYFVDKGMCADWAIHDSENEKGQRNLHIHVLLTMRPLTENGEWGAKQKKIYDLDENGEKIPVIDKKTGQQKVDKRNRKQWKCHTADSIDWNSRENAKIWRKDLADTINATNEQLGIALHWEHR